MIKIVLATHNPGKAKEITDRLKGYPVISEPLAYYPQIPEITEDGKTFRDNALIKARLVAQKTNLPALADDSGLEIDYLGGKPGIYSSRWGNTDQERIRKTIEALRNTTNEQRTARFVCVMSLVIPEQKIYYITKGICPGRITLSPAGDSGFGYDPVFIPQGYDQTFAQLGERIKNRISHRAIALEKMVKIIVDHFQL